MAEKTWSKKDKVVPLLNAYVINTAIKYKIPVCLVTKSGKEYIGVMKRVVPDESRDVTLYKVDNPNKLYVTVNYDSIEAVLMLEGHAEKDSEPVPF